jgi:cytochrome c553
VLLASCVAIAASVWPRSSDAQAAAPPSEQEAERRRLLDRLGLKKRPAPAAPAPAAPPPKDEPAEEKERTEPPGAEAEPPAATPAPPGLTFSGRVHASLLGACRSCHGATGVAARSGYVLDGTLEADFAATRRFIRVGQPDDSALLRLASGAGHAGGAVLEPASSDHQLLSRWIAEGARRGGPASAAVAVVAATPSAPPLDGSRSSTATPPAPPPAPSTAAAPSREEVPLEPIPPGAPIGATTLAYAPTVHDALTQSCASCHRADATAASTRYVLTGDVSADFASAQRFVDHAQPEASPLLVKASGVAHGGGAIYPPGSEGYLRLLEWIQLGASGPTAPVLTPATSALDASAAAPAPPANGPAPPLAAAPAPHGSAAAAHASGMRLPFDFRLNGRFDLNYERRNFDTQPFSGGDDVIRSYHHFVFLSRHTEDDPVGFSAELVNLTFWEAQYRLSLPESVGQAWLKAGKLLVPFGPDPLFHQSYGGLTGFDQRVLPVIWAQEGASARFSRERGELSWAADVYAVRGHELRQRDAVLNLQGDLSPLDSVHVAVGARLRASWHALSLFYSAYANGLGFGRALYLQAADVSLWRLRGVPVLENIAAELGLLRADISGAGAGQDYFHFASYFRLRYFLTEQVYAQYRQGLRTFDNRRGVFIDDTRLTRDDGSTHNFGLVARTGPLTFGAYYFFNLEKADEVTDDFLRITGVYEF